MPPRPIFPEGSFGWEENPKKSGSPLPRKKLCLPVRVVRLPSGGNHPGNPCGGKVIEKEFEEGNLRADGAQQVT